MKEIVLTRLQEFLSTEQRKNIFLCYLFEDMSQSDVLEYLKNFNNPPSSSTVDRVTASFVYLGILNKKEIKENKQIYNINWDMWLQEVFLSLGFKNIDDESIEKIENLIKNKLLITFYYCLMQPDTFKEFLQQSMDNSSLKKLKDEGLPAELIMQYIIKTTPNLSYYPSFYISITGNPFLEIFKKYDQLNKEEEEKIINLFNNIIDNSICKNFTKKIDEQAKKEVSTLLDNLAQETKKLFISYIKKEVQEA